MDKTCWDCSQRIGEECGVNGREVYEDTEACGMFEQERDAITWCEHGNMLVCEECAERNGY